MMSAKPKISPGKLKGDMKRAKTNDLPKKFFLSIAMATIVPITVEIKQDANATTKLTMAESMNSERLAISKYHLKL